MGRRARYAVAIAAGEVRRGSNAEGVHDRDGHERLHFGEFLRQTVRSRIVNIKDLASLENTGINFTKLFARYVQPLCDVSSYRPCSDKSCRVSFRFEGCLDGVNLGALSTRATTAALKCVYSSTPPDPPAPLRFTWSQAVAGTLRLRTKACEFTESGLRTTVAASATQGAHQCRCSAKTSTRRC